MIELEDKVIDSPVDEKPNAHYAKASWLEYDYCITYCGLKISLKDIPTFYCEAPPVVMCSECKMRSHGK